MMIGTAMTIYLALLNSYAQVDRTMTLLSLSRSYLIFGSKVDFSSTLCR